MLEIVKRVISTKRISLKHKSMYLLIVLMGQRVSSSDIYNNGYCKESKRAIDRTMKQLGVWKRFV